MRPNHRTVRYRVQDRMLYRAVLLDNGRQYQHGCRMETFKKVAVALAEVPEDGLGTSMEQLADAEGLPYTQTNVALEFLKERGVAVVRHRRIYPASEFACEDAMIEFCALGDLKQEVVLRD